MQVAKEIHTFTSLLRTNKAVYGGHILYRRCMKVDKRLKTLMACKPNADQASLIDLLLKEIQEATRYLVMEAHTGWMLLPTGLLASLGCIYTHYKGLSAKPSIEDASVPESHGSQAGAGPKRMAKKKGKAKRSNDGHT
uniref:Uncharacterized protein n=1 Tax=Eutreptiella gymnastica TaxID=73025 RepID=A0A7S1IEI0_9EUGL|mmetsp:Transcript_150431/g.262847  ORF Transcript_150431/g.262847 Transcript_150431/m.262847 type:complete len:138 (+) Transcript_150431:80-493(+)